MLRTFCRKYSSVPVGESYKRFGTNLSSLSNKELRELSDVLKSQPVEDTDFVKNFIKIVNVREDLNERKEIINGLVSNYLSQDFSIFYAIDKSLLSNDSLSHLLVHNPGRVKSSWDFYKELFQKSENDNVLSNEVHLALLGKLLNGEKFEAGEFEIDLENIMRSVEVFNKLEDSNHIYWDSFLNNLITMNIPSAIQLVPSNLNELKRFLITNEYTSATAKSYMKIFNFFIEKASETDRDLIDADLIIKGLTCLNSADLKDSENLNDLNLLVTEKVQSIAIDSYETIFEIINEQSLDKGDTVPALLLRLKYLDTVGMYQSNLPKSLELFHHYQIHEKYQSAIIQNKMVQVFCYNAIKEHNPTHLKVAETLLLDSIPIGILHSLILANSEFDIDKALEIYNNYIQKVSKTVNEKHVSPTGLLTEAVILSFLYNNDREFAFLINDKARENGIISDELEVARIKKLFKLYGDSMADEDWNIAKSMLKDSILQAVRTI